jgi:hypothetical protein
VSLSSHHNASNGGEVMPSKSQHAKLAKTIMDLYNLDEPVPDCLNFEAMTLHKFVNDGLDLLSGLTIPIEQDLYNGRFT